MTTLIISNEKVNDIMKIVRYLEESGLLIKEQTGRFLDLLLGKLGTTLLGNLLTGKCTVRAGDGTIRSCEGTIRASKDLQCHLIL